MSLTLGAERSEGRQGLSLAALGAVVERAMEEAHRLGIDTDSIEPKVSVTPRGKIRKIEVTIP